MSSAPWQKPFRGMQIDKTHPLAKGLVGCWVFNEKSGDTVFDMSGNGNHGTNNGADWVPEGLNFVAANTDYIHITDDASTIGLTNTAGTIFSTFKAYTQPTPTAYIVAHRDGTENNRLYLIIRQASNDFNCGFGDDYDAIATDNNVENDGLFHTGAMTWDTVGAEGYLDSVSMGTYNYNLPTVDGPIIIGARQDLDEYFNGVIKNVMLWNRTLSPEEIAWLNREPYAMFQQPISPASLYYEAVAAEANPYWYYQMLKRRN